MSAIMRRRRSLIGLSLIEGSCPEVGVLELAILRTGRPPRHPLSISRLARSSPFAPLPRERVRSLAHLGQATAAKRMTAPTPTGVSPDRGEERPLWGNSGRSQVQRRRERLCPE